MDGRGVGGIAVGVDDAGLGGEVADRIVGVRLAEGAAREGQAIERVVTERAAPGPCRVGDLRDVAAAVIGVGEVLEGGARPVVIVVFGRKCLASAG
jgi:hypothetical protein